jgi:dihydrofolate reductase
MRKLVVSEFVSVDGVFEDPGGAEGFKYGGWSMEFNGPDNMQFKHDELMAADILLLGRVTYEGFAKAWPKVQGAGDFGEKMNSMPKVVVSSTLEKADWQNSTIIKDNVLEEIKKLKESKGGNILVGGSGKLVNFLLENNLVDELNLMIYPVILATGKKLLTTHQKLSLLEAKSYDKGVVVLRYQPE